MSRNKHLQVERSYCDCQKCQAACRTMPGSLAPGDMEKIAGYLRQPFDNHFIKNHFAASDGALVITRDGPMQVPTVVPQQTSQGRCLFLTENNQCAIHPVAPFGCRNFTVCGKDATVHEANCRSAAMIDAIITEPEHRYFMHWADLKEEGIEVSPLRERRAALDCELEKINSSSDSDNKHEE